MASEARIISMAEQRAARGARGVDGDEDVAVAGGDPTERTRCAATTATGNPCRNYAVAGDRCRVHAPPTRTAGTGSDTSTPPSTSRPSMPAASRARPIRTPTSPARTGRASLFSDPDGAVAPRADTGRRPDDAFAPDREAFARAERELVGRGYAGAIDALEALRDQADDRWLDALRGMVGFLRRRLTGDYDIDEFGFDEDLTTHVLMPLLRPLHRHYWRVTSHGIGHVPAEGGALLVANHAGTLPADALITRLDVFDLTGRHARELGADLVFRTPFVGELARKTGATLASGDDADRLLAAGELVAVWPEGYKGLGKPWRDRYKLQRFGRGGFVATALRAQVPIVPTAIVGSEEIYPLLFDLRIVARVLGVPYFPVVAQMLALPVLGPFALLPLPSKWVIEYGEPIETESLGSALADDPMALFDLTDQVRDRIQGMVHRNLMGRRSVFL